MPDIVESMGRVVDTLFSRSQKVVCMKCHKACDLLEHILRLLLWRLLTPNRSKCYGPAPSHNVSPQLPPVRCGVRMCSVPTNICDVDEDEAGNRRTSHFGHPHGVEAASMHPQLAVWMCLCYDDDSY